MTSLYSFARTSCAALSASLFARTISSVWLHHLVTFSAHPPIGSLPQHQTTLVTLAATRGRRENQVELLEQSELATECAERPYCSLLSCRSPFSERLEIPQRCRKNPRAFLQQRPRKPTVTQFWLRSRQRNQLRHQHWSRRRKGKCEFCAWERRIQTLCRQQLPRPPQQSHRRLRAQRRLLHRLKMLLFHQGPHQQPPLRAPRLPPLPRS